VAGDRQHEAALIDALPTAFIAIDRDGHYLAFNRAAENLLGARPEADARAGAPRYLELFHPDGRPMADHEIPLVRAMSGEVIEGAEVIVKSRRYPAGRHVSASAAPLRDERGVPFGAGVALHDITDLVETRRRVYEAARALERSHKMDAIGRLAGAVAHDFNNLLTVIASYAHLLEPTFESGDERAAEVAEIRRAAERAEALTKQLLTMSRHSAAQIQRVDLAKVVTELGAPLRRLAGSNVEVVIRAGVVPAVDVDPVQIEQALINLVVNARDAMSDGGRIIVEADQQDLAADAAALRALAPGRYAVIAVTDTGSGIAPEIQRHIFEPYFTTKEGHGTGLGLSIVHGIVKQARGAVTVYSEVGHGTTFRMFLPEAHGEPAARRPAVEVVAPDRLPPITVLIADDDHQVRTAAGRVLTAAGCRVLEAGTADEARRACASDEASIDALLIDVVLSDGRGDTLARQLVELRPDLRVVVTSGFAAGVIDGGPMAARCLAKPYTPAELRAAIAAVTTDQEGRVRNRPTPPILHSGSPKVLVVDDDALVRRSIVRILQVGGCQVAEADGGRAAAEHVERSPVDVIVSDLEMPGGGGLDLLRRVRRVDLDVPVILITGKPDVRSAAEAIQHGVFRYMTKPLDLDLLEKAVRHAARVHALAKIRREAFSATGNAHARAAADRAGLEVRLDAAIDSLWLAFQPIVDARTGAPYGVEALMRCDEPSMPGPEDVLSAATELGRLYQLGRRIRALGAAAFDKRGDGLTLFVNLHPDDLLDAELIADSAPLIPIAKRVVLEVTERSSLRSSAALSARLARLRELGFRLAIDDIGAGYSGLTSFADLIPEVVKVDMSLVRDVHHSPVKQRTIRSLCSLTHEVGGLVIGEGVETEAERDCLRGLGCDLFQGYLFGRPVRDLPG
jgi:PAS domain S-box-containing protein